MMTRRDFLASSLAASAASAAPGSMFGVATTCYMTVWRPRETYEFLEHCNSIGAAGIQAGLTSLEDAYLTKLRARAEQLGMYIEVMAGLPPAAPEPWIKTMEAAKKAGAICVRSSSPLGRRYEKFSSLDDWKREDAKSRDAVARGVQIANRLKMPWVIENHKEWLTEDLTAMFQQYSSEYFGCCLDTGNNIAMLDDPIDTVERLAPWAISTHIKDMGVAEYEDGFLLSELPLGTGMLDLRRILETIRRARPKTKLTLEMITRDPLKIPCFTDKYWATWPERSGRDLARTMRLVKAKSQKLPMLSALSPADQKAAEHENVVKCLAWS